MVVFGVKCTYLPWEGMQCSVCFVLGVGRVHRLVTGSSLPSAFLQVLRKSGRIRGEMYMRLMGRRGAY